MIMPCRISDSGDDEYVGIDEDGFSVRVKIDGQTGDVIEEKLMDMDDIEIPMEDDDRRQLDDVQDGSIIADMNILNKQVEQFKKIFGGF